MYRSQPHLQWLLSLIFLVVILPLLLDSTSTVQKSEARPLNPNMEVEGAKNPSSFSTLVKDQYVANKGENLRSPPIWYSPPSHIGNHKMSAGPRVHGGDQYVPLDKRPVIPSAPNPTIPHMGHDAISKP